MRCCHARKCFIGGFVSSIPKILLCLSNQNTKYNQKLIVLVGRVSEIKIEKDGNVEMIQTDMTGSTRGTPTQRISTIQSCGKLLVLAPGLELTFKIYEMTMRFALLPVL